MEDPPPSIWRLIGDDKESEPVSRLSVAWLHAYADVYHVMRTWASADVCDRCEVWQLAAMTGLHVDTVDMVDDVPAGVTRLQPRGESAQAKADREFLARRRAWLETGQDPDRPAEVS